MKKNPIISVVIPCFNCEKTIVDCLDSIDGDSSNCEIILVDDCSTDSSLSIINSYIESHPNKLIKCIKNKSNLGAGQSRNHGIYASSGDYIVFLDSDDCFINQPIVNLLSVVNNNYDCVIFDAFLGSKKRMKMFFSNHMKQGVISTKDAVVYTKGCSCGKLYKSSIIKNNNIVFGNFKVNEDLVFTKTALSFCSSITYINDVFYLYKDNNQSLMHTTNRRELANHYLAPSFNILESRLSNRLFEKEINSIYFIEILYSSSLSLFLSKEKRNLRKKTFRELIKRYNRNDPYYHHYSVKYKILVLFFKFIYWTFY